MTHVQELMSSPAVSCQLSDSLNRAAQIMWDHDCGCVPVVDPLNHVVGIVTDRDVCMGAYTQGRALFDIAVSSVCTRELHTIGPHDSLDHAQAVMAKHQVRRLPVVSADGQLVGVLSLSDLARRVPHASISKSRSTNALSSVVEAVSRWRNTHAGTESRRYEVHPDSGRHMKPSS